MRTGFPGELGFELDSKDVLESDSKWSGGVSDNRKLQGKEAGGVNCWRQEGDLGSLVNCLLWPTRVWASSYRAERAN